MTPIENAKRLGTYNAIDRSKQYAETDNAALLRAVNEAWSKIRNCEKSLTARNNDIEQLRKKLRRSQIVNIALTSIITSLAWEGLRTLVGILK